MSKTVHVAVGVIFRENLVFLTKRANDVHQGGKWEFPGGKVEDNETVQQALLRELKEEVAVDILSCQPLVVIEHDYGDKKVCLEVFLVDDFLNEPTAQEGQQQSWYSLQELKELDFPAANQQIVDLLLTRYLINVT